MKTIVAAVDFSPVSANALNFAADLALAINARLLICNIYNIPVAFGEVPLALVSPEDIRLTTELQLLSLQDLVVERTNGKLTVMNEARMGDVIDELESLCQSVKPFAIVMGAKGKTGLEKIIYGSTALKAVRHLSSPVLCVPPKAEYGKGFRKIGLACDFKKIEVTTPVSLIREIVQDCKAELHILNVDYLQRHFTPETPAVSHRLQIMFQGLDPKIHFIDYPDIEEGIEGFAIDNGIDLLIAIPKHHNLLDILFKPSSTRQLILHSQLPVMCVR